jgi:hypothetical protein
MAMKKEKKVNRSTTRASDRDAGATSEHKPVALTLKIDREMYQRLLQLRAFGEKLRTHQDILRQALQEYLDRAGV